MEGSAVKNYDAITAVLLIGGPPVPEYLRVDQEIAITVAEIATLEAKLARLRAESDRIEDLMEKIYVEKYDPRRP